MIRITLTAALASALAAGGGQAPAAPLPALPAQVVPIQRPVSAATFATQTYANGKPAKKGTTTWRVVQGTGNCCENYLTITPNGRLLDFGGSFINLTDDRGLTWLQVQPLTPLVNGEGTIALAPNGDVIAIGWDPYSGDHLQAFKYEAASASWFYFEQPLHQPFYDREWVAVLPGPFSIDGRTYPYVSLLKGGYPWKDPAFYSTDGLTYTDATSQFLDETSGSPLQGYLPTKADSTFDWIQPNSNGGMTPLGGANAFASGEFTSDYGYFDGSDRTWSAFTYPGGVQPEGRYQVDSAGRLNDLVPRSDGFDYRISSDGGRSWKSVSVALPGGYSLDQIDFRANKAVGIAAVAVHALNTATGNDQDWAYVIDIRRDPVLKRRYTLGLGDTGSAAGVGNSIRMDFQTVAIFPDGRIALSFLDSTTSYPSPTTGQQQTRPAIAIEQGSAY
jgi:hypothetical protein